MYVRSTLPKLTSLKPLKCLTAVVATLLLCGCAYAKQPGPIQYTVKLGEPQTQMVDVMMTIPDVTGESIDIHFPTWRPGRYLIIDPAGTIQNIKAIDEHGQRLGLSKIDKSTWRIAAHHATRVTVSWRVYANSLSDRTRHVDDSHAFLSGESIFMYVDDRHELPHELTFEVPETWRIATGLKPVVGSRNTYAATDFDHLVDSPFEIGTHQVLHFNVDDKPHEIVIWGTCKIDDETLITDFRSIVEVQRDLFGTLPYERYVFMLHVAPGLGGGTEHRNSTIMQTRCERLESEDDYQRFLRLVSHEMFHTWNVKRFRPAGIFDYDYKQENYTTLLWVAEGTTSYYDNLMLARSGLIDTDEYLKRLSSSIDAFRRRPGRGVQSLNESSFDAWIKYNKRHAGSVNSTVSFYDKGALVSLMLDMRIRALSDGTSSLDDVMRMLNVRFGDGSAGYTPTDFQRLCEEAAGAPLQEFFDTYVAGTHELPLEEVLATAGLALTFGLASDEESSSKETTCDDVDVPYLGIDVRDELGKAIVSRVYADGPAYHAGILPDDEILAINSRRIAANDWKERIEKLSLESAAKLTISRRDALRTLEVTPMRRRKGEWTIRHMDAPSPEQRATFEAWTHQAWTDTQPEP